MVSAWFDRLSSWQFVLVVASCAAVGFAVEAWVSTLGNGHLNLHSFIVFAVVDSAVLTFVTAWKRWR